MLRKISGNILLMLCAMSLAVAMPCTAYAEGETAASSTEAAPAATDPAGAGDIDYEAAEKAMDQLASSMAKIQVSLTVPEGFTTPVEVYFNEYPVRMFYDETVENNGYTRPAFVTPGHCDVKYLVDGMTGYTVNGPAEFDVSDGAVFDATVVEDENATSDADEAEGDGDEHDAIDPSDQTEAEITPLEFDYSDGKPTGTLHIKAKYCAAILSADYKITAPDGTVYDIPLDRDHLFEADVKLPASGDPYHDASGTTVTLDQDAQAPDAQSFHWGRQGQDENAGTVYFDKYFTIAEGQEASIDDLVMMMSYEGQNVEVSSDMLYAASLAKNAAKAQSEANEEQMKKNFPERFTEAETEAPVEAVVAKKINIGMIAAAAAVVVLAVTAGIVIVKRRTKR